MRGIPRGVSMVLQGVSIPILHTRGLCRKAGRPAVASAEAVALEPSCCALPERPWRSVALALSLLRRLHAGRLATCPRHICAGQCMMFNRVLMHAGRPATFPGTPGRQLRGMAPHPLWAPPAAAALWTASGDSLLQPWPAPRPWSLLEGGAPTKA